MYAYGTYTPSLMLLTLLIAFLASFITFFMLDKIHHIHGRTRSQWLFSGAIVIGLGLWSVHYIAVLAHHLPVQITYDLGFVLLSMIIAIASAYFTLRFYFRTSRPLQGALLMGNGIILLHFIGMYAMEVQGAHAHFRFDLLLVAGSIILTMAGTCFTFFFHARLRKMPLRSSSLWHIVLSLILAGTIVGMHVMGMMALQITLSSHTHKTPSIIIDHTLLAVLLAIGATLFLGFMVVLIFMQRALQRMQDQTALILHSAADGIAVTDTNGTILLWNRAAEIMTGYQSSEMAGKNLSTMTNSICPSFAKLPAGSIIDDSFIRKDGSTFPVEITAKPFHEYQEMGGIVITFRDISERKRTEELLRQAETLSIAGQLAAGVAHEICNPLTSLKGFFQLLQSGVPLKAEYFRIMDAEMERIQEIITELLFLAKPQAKTYQSTPLEELIDQACAQLTASAQEHNVQIEKIFPGHPLLINCDHTQIKQVCLNLLKNGMEAMPGGGTITIEAKAENQMAVLQFIDRGIGIPPEILDKIGQPFYTTKAKGTGLGLMVSYNIIQNHHGSISVSSKPNIGTTFTIRLPLEHEQAAAKDPQMFAAN